MTKLSEESLEWLEVVTKAAVLMKEHGLTSLKHEGYMELIRNEKADYYEALGKQAAAVAAKPQPTEEELLTDPYVGLGDDK
jgi:hypothetical protein